MAEWDTGLFECFTDIKVLLVSCFLGPCQLAYQKAAVEDHECNIMDLVYTFFCNICCAVIIRGKIRERYGIDGSLLMDVAAAWCCGLCAVSQQTRQLEIKGAKPSGMFME